MDKEESFDISLFSKASTLQRDKYGYVEEEDYKRMQVASGLKNFKRRTMGLCGRSTTKTLDELSKVLMDIKMAKSPQEGRELVYRLDGKSLLSYYCDVGPINIRKVKDAKGNEAYRVNLQFVDIC